jgi:hypothetical protein
LTLTEPLGLIAPLAPEEAEIVGLTVNELLIPEIEPSVVVIVTPEPAAVTVTEVDPTPLTKAFIAPGLIAPAEYVKDGVPV